MTELMQKLFTVSDAAIRACGLFVPNGDSDPDILSVSIDSRSVRKGDLFIALKGEFTDGHNYISMAFKSGASAVMISDGYYADNKSEISSPGYPGCLIVVKDTLLGFHKLAGSWVAGFDGLIRIAVTGSNGKSTTKEMIGAILSEDGSTIINEGNLNSETGLPLSVLNIDTHHKYGVFEMG
ncbi:MAG: UDP-N-acetylmuramoyl-tripeptide--D-alanyl-D-alanine ligase, partial [Spirochaetales bacterium]|nr:UDP-N-acetylmuramoyl-tripeptide--D-alanyl-D-alanine ligase [Spirochaetales bacterium]